MNNADEALAIIVSWKDKQEDFNKIIIAQIASLQASLPRPRNNARE